jgi:hypothetical protein
MSRDVLIEAMAKAICRTFYQTEWADTSWFRRDICLNMAAAALDALRAARPDIAGVLDGKAEVMPVEISKDDAEGIWEAAYDVWAEFGATDADAGREAHRAALAASPYRSAK